MHSGVRESGGLFDTLEEAEAKAAELNEEVVEVKQMTKEDVEEIKQEWKKLQEENMLMPIEVIETNEEPDIEEYWEDIGAKSNMHQVDYDELKNSESTVHLSIALAAHMIANDLGFQEEKVKILTEVPNLEISNTGKTRSFTLWNRHPCYASSDWNYIHFEVCGWRYELINGELYIYD